MAILTRLGVGCVAQPLHRLTMIAQMPYAVTNLCLRTFIISRFLKGLTRNSQLTLIPILYGHAIHTVQRHGLYRCRRISLKCGTGCECEWHRARQYQFENCINLHDVWHVWDDVDIQFWVAHDVHGTANLHQIKPGVYEAGASQQ